MALIPPFFFDCVVAIGERAVDKHISFTATGFLYGKLVIKGESAETNQYRVYLITNRHVFEGRDAVVLRFNTLGGAPAKIYDVSLKDNLGQVIYFLHPDPEIDIAVVSINVQLLQQEGILFGFFHSDKHVLPLQKATGVGVAEGEGIFLLGFPMGDAGKDQNFVIARQGAIARIRDAIAGKSKHFLIDAAIFPGNSGGPVVTKPEIVSIQGTQAHSEANLIGIVAGYIPFQDIAISVQTKRPRIIFEENSGLGVVFSIEDITAVVERADLKQVCDTTRDIRKDGAA